MPPVNRGHKKVSGNRGRLENIHFQAKEGNLPLRGKRIEIVLLPQLYYVNAQIYYTNR